MQTHHRHQRSAARLLAPVIIVTPWRLRLRPSVRPPVAADRPPSQWGMLSLTRSQSSWVMTIFKWRALDTGRALTIALGRSEIGGVIHYKYLCRTYRKVPGGETLRGIYVYIEFRWSWFWRHASPRLRVFPERSRHYAPPARQ